MINSEKSDYKIVDYASITTNDPNPFKRKLQNIRLHHSITKIIQNEKSAFNGNLLDFGSGNGELSKRLSQLYQEMKIYCYEPAKGYREQAERNLAGIKNVRIIPDLEQMGSISFDYIVCLEVFEHLPENKIKETLNIFFNILDDDGIIIIGVPVEIYLPALVKGFFRMIRRYGDVDALPINIIRAAVGKPSRTRPVKEIDTGLPYIFRHIGFDYRRLEKLLKIQFNIVKRYGSPFTGLPVALNFESYYVCKRQK